MATLKEVLDSKRTIFSPVVYDGLTARIAEMSGFEVASIGGLNVAASHFALPDIGLLTLTEMVERAKAVVRAVNIPVICDADTGFGGINNTRRMVQEYEAAGISCAQIEDQTFPCRCGWMPGKAVIPVEEYVPKLKAAVEARKCKDFLIIGRTDCKEELGMGEVIRRLNIYADNGADIAASGSGFTFKEYEQMVKEIKIPVKANCSIDQLTIPLKQWEDVGVKLVGYMHLPLYFSMKAIAKSMQALKNGTLGDMKGELVAEKEIREILKTEEWLKWLER